MSEMGAKPTDGSSWPATDRLLSLGILRQRSFAHTARSTVLRGRDFGGSKTFMSAKMISKTTR